MKKKRRIVNFLFQNADVGLPLTMRHVADAVRIIVSSMDPIRRMHLPFKNGTPRIKFFRAFMKRHKEDLEFIRSLKQEHMRFKAINAYVLCDNFACLAKTFAENDLDAARIWNLDECGVSPNRDANRKSKKKRITRRGAYGINPNRKEFNART